MLLTRVDVQNSRGDTLALPLGDTSGGYVVRNLDGLDPVQATLTSAAYAQSDGGQLQSARRDTRNITGKIGFAPDYSTNTVRSLKRNLYNYLLPKSSVTLSFYFDGAVYAQTSATVETFTDAMFAQDSEVDLSLMCYDPDFYAPAATTVNGTTVTDGTTQAIQYDGSSDCGIIFTLQATAAVTGFSLYNTRDDNVQQLFQVEDLTLQAGDVVTVNTIPGQKAITLTRGGSVSSLLYSVDPSSVWPSLTAGENDFRCLCNVGSLDYTVVYTSKYAGL